MARPLRIQYPGAYYHVMSRGNSRQDIFLAEEDRSIFLAGLADSCETYGVRLIAYVLMGNHFHLLVQTEQANLSEFMRHVLVTYTVRWNRKWKRTGHLFQGRYKSLLIDEDAYLLPLSRYIHLNPVRTKEFVAADSKKKAGYLRNYKWSSLPGYCSSRKRIGAVDYSWLLTAYFGGDKVKGRRQYWSYVYQGIKGEVENPFDDVFHQAILGTEEFVEGVKAKISWGKEREVPALRGLRRSVSVDKILEMIGSRYAMEAAEILDRKTTARFIRQAALELCYRYSPKSQKELGELFGVDYSTVSQNRSRLKRKLQDDGQLKKQFDEIERQLNQLSK